MEIDEKGGSATIPVKGARRWNGGRYARGALPPAAIGALQVLGDWGGRGGTHHNHGLREVAIAGEDTRLANDVLSGIAARVGVHGQGRQGRQGRQIGAAGRQRGSNRNNTGTEGQRVVCLTFAGRTGC